MKLGSTLPLAVVLLAFACLSSAQIRTDATFEGAEGVDSAKVSPNDDCLQQLQDILTPQFSSDLISMVSMSGKGINQLGLYDACNENPDFEYVLLSVKDKVKKAILMSIGICGPKKWNTPENYSRLGQQLVSFAKSNPQLANADLEGIAIFPEQVNSEKLDAGAWTMITILILIVCLWIIGLIVQFTPLGDKNSGNGERDENIKIEDRKTKLALFFYSFNPYANLLKIFTISKGGEQALAVLNGVRILSICWVVVGHTFSFTQFAPILNFSTFFNMMSDSAFFVVPGGFFAVDSFFFLSGFLTFYLLTAKMYKKTENFFLLYFHRYYRLIFPVVFVVAFSTWLMKYLGNGPVYKRSWDLFLVGCQKNWWQNFLFINNFYPWELGEECTGWMWYLANDFQFFLISPPIIYAFCKKRIFGYIACLSVLCVSVLTNAIITAIYNISVTNTEGDINGMDVLYVKPWSRIGAYLVGAIFGFWYFELALKEKYPELQSTISNGIFERLKKSRILSITFMLVGIAITFLYILPLQRFLIDWKGAGNCYSTFASTMYNLSCRPMFVFGLGLILMPTFVGRLRLIKSFLGAETFMVLARLNYMVYMVHCLVVLWIISDFKQPAYMVNLNEWFLAIGCVVISFIAAVPATLMFEAPFLNIEKYILFPPKKRPSKAGEANGQEEGSQELKRGPKYFPLDDETMDSKNKKLLE